MIVAALLHPDVSPRAVERFRHPNSTLNIQENLEDSDHLDAALIFGGDGTVHRYLPGLSQSRIPMLVVPAGSGNDFAKALGISNVGIALRAWRRFCERGDNVRA